VPGGHCVRGHSILRHLIRTYYKPGALPTELLGPTDCVQSNDLLEAKTLLVLQQRVYGPSCKDQITYAEVINGVCVH
jgi:hypothetical protein